MPGGAAGPTASNQGEATYLPPGTMRAVPPAAPSLSVASPPEQLAQARRQGANALGYGSMLLSPEEQRGIIQSAGSAVGLMQQGQQIQQQAGEQGFMQDFRNRELALRKMKTESDMRGDTAQSALIGEKINDLRLERDLLMSLPPGERPYARFAPRDWAEISQGVGRGTGGLTGDAKSAKVAYVKYIAANMFPGDPEADAKAIAYVNKATEGEFVEDMLKYVVMPGQVPTPKDIDKLRETYQYIHGTAPTTKTPSVSESPSWKKFNELYK